MIEAIENFSREVYKEMSVKGVIEIVLDERCYNKCLSVIEGNFRIHDTSDVNPFTGKVTKKNSWDDYQESKKTGLTVLTINTMEGPIRIRKEQDA